MGQKRLLQIKPDAATTGSAHGELGLGAPIVPEQLASKLNNLRDALEVMQGRGDVAASHAVLEALGAIQTLLSSPAKGQTSQPAQSRPGLHQLVAAMQTVVRGTQKKTAGPLVSSELSMAMVLLEQALSSPSHHHSRDDSSEAEMLGIMVSRLQAVDQGLLSLDHLKIPQVQWAQAGKVSGERTAMTNVFEQLGILAGDIEEIINDFTQNSDPLKVCGVGGLPPSTASKDQADSVDLEGLFKPLQQMRGIFQVLNKPMLAQLIDHVSGIWRKIREQGCCAHDPQFIKDCVTLMGGLSLYITALRQDNDAEADEVYETLMGKFQRIQMDRGGEVTVYDFNAFDDTPPTHFQTPVGITPPSAAPVEAPPPLGLSLGLPSLPTFGVAPTPPAPATTAPVAVANPATNAGFSMPAFPDFAVEPEKSPPDPQILVQRP